VLLLLLLLLLLLPFPSLQSLALPVLGEKKEVVVLGKSVRKHVAPVVSSLLNSGSRPNQHWVGIVTLLTRIVWLGRLARNPRTGLP
jgi:hypothetical protein